MIPAQVWLRSVGRTDTFAIVRLAFDREVRIRQRRHTWHCEQCGDSKYAKCAHARAVINNTNYQVEIEP